MPQAPSPARRVLTFGVGGRRYAIDASEVEAVITAPPVTRVPQAPPALKGVANVRGRAAPIVAVERLLDDVAPAPRLGAGGRVIMLGGAAPVGLAVDEINAVREIEARRADGPATEMIETAEGVLRVLRPEDLLAAAFAGVSRDRPAGRAQIGSAEAAQAHAPETAFLEFRLSGQAYAVALDEVREISRAPATIQALPGADAAMLGLIALRERLLPVVSAAAVLGLTAEAPAGAQARIVVLGVGETEIGLLVDAVRGVTRAPADRVSAAPAILNRAAGEARIDTILRTDTGLVSILAAERVLDDDTVAGLLAQDVGRSAPASEQKVGEAMQRFVIFRLGDEVYGLPIEDVEAVIRLPQTVTRVPGAPPFVAGVINHRGRVTPLVDQALRFSASGGVAGARRRVIIASLDGLSAGFIVDAVDQVVSIPETALQAAPELAAGEAGVFDRVASVEHGGALVLLVDPRQLLDQAERDILRALAADPAARSAP